MRKKSLKNLTLSKKSVADLNSDLKGGRPIAFGESHFNTVCPFCNTDKDLCEVIR